MPAPIPEVSLTSDITTLVEDEGTEVTFTVSLSESPPEGGIVVAIGTGKAFALGDFDIFPPPPQASATGGQLVGGFSDNSGFNFLVTAQTATITLPIFDDLDRVPDGSVTNPDDELRNDDQGEEQTTFTVQSGDGYTVAPNANSVTLTLRDTNVVNTPPVADDDSYSTAFNTALTIDAAEGVLNGDTDADEDPLSAEIATDPSNGAVTLNADGSFTYTPNADFSGDDSFTYTVSDGNGGSDEGVVTVTVGDNTGGEIVVSFTATPDSLNEEEGTPITFDFTVTGDFPQEGIIIRTDENFFPNPQLDFNLLDFENPEVISGIEFVDFEEVSTGRFLIDWRLTQPEAFIKVAVFDDNLAEPDGSFTTGLLPGEGYTLDPDATTATVFVTDGVDGVGGPVVSLAVDQTEVNEGDPLTITLAAEGDIPADGLEVFVDSETVGAIGDFITVDSDGNPTVTFTGLAGFPAPNEDGSGFTVVMNDNTATISFDVFDDGPGEGLETFEFSILDGENYDVSAEASSVAISIDEGGTSTEPVVSLDVAPAVVSEEEEGASVTLTFTVEGEIPTPEFDANGNLVSGGLSILFDGSDVTPIFEEITGGPVIDGFVVGDFADPAQP